MSTEPGPAPPWWRLALGEGWQAWLVSATVLLVGLVVHWFLGGAWLAEDLDSAAAICCDHSGWVVSRVEAVESARALGREAPAWKHRDGAATEVGLALWRLWPGDPDFLQRGVLWSSLLAQLLLFVGVGRLRGPWFGALAAGLLPLLPIVAFAERRWDSPGSTLSLMALAFLLVTASRSLTRVPLALGIGALAALLVAWSPMFSDNLLMVCAVGAMCAGAMLRGLILGTGPRGARVHRLLVLVGALSVCAALYVGVFEIVELPLEKELDRYDEELEVRTGEQGSGPWSTAPGLAYLGHLYWRGLTPWLAIPCLLALPLALRRRGGRAELFCWLVVPTALLMAISKRNFYYLFVIYSALPALLAMGVAGLPRFGPLRPLAGLVLLCVGATQIGARSFPRSDLGAALEDVSWIRGDADFGGLFQTVDHDLRLHPSTNADSERLAAAVDAALPELPCRCRAQVYIERADASVVLELSSRRPCLRRVSRLADRSAGGVGAMLLHRPSGPEPRQRSRKEQVSTDGFEQADSGFSEQQLWLRPASWWANQCPEE